MQLVITTRLQSIMKLEVTKRQRITPTARMVMRHTLVSMASMQAAPTLRNTARNSSF
jgi:hypothetical protein